MSHLVSYKWIRRTRNITSIGLIYKNVEFYLGVYLTLMSKVGVEPAYEIPPIACKLFFLIN